MTRSVWDSGFLWNILFSCSLLVQILSMSAFTAFRAPWIVQWENTMIIHYLLQILKQTGKTQFVLVVHFQCLKLLTCTEFAILKISSLLKTKAIPGFYMGDLRSYGPAAVQSLKSFNFKRSTGNQVLLCFSHICPETNWLNVLCPCGNVEVGRCTDDWADKVMRHDKGGLTRNRWHIEVGDN